MDKEKEHIIADKTMLRVARVTSSYHADTI